MKYPVTEYTTLVFDCDGVVLNSNKVKTDAFYQATLPYGEAAAQAMVDYHVANGGVSRYRKFAHFLEKIIPENVEKSRRPCLERLLNVYAGHVWNGLLNCEIASGLEEFRRKTPNSRWLIASGGDQAELRELFRQRCIAEWFDGGIFGSPDSKDEVLARELSTGNIQRPSLFIGDSKYDYQAACSSGMDFVYLSKWSEVKDWESWVNKNEIVVMQDILELAR